MLFPVVSRARRRLLWNSIAAQSANAVSVGMGAVVCLLLLGTDLVDWRWAVGLPFVVLAAGIYLVARRIPDRYATARIVDARLKLADSLSTALFFAAARHAARCDAGMCEAQRQMAASVAGNLDVRAAVPMEMPRTAYVAASLVIVAGGLVALRYGIEGALDLRPPMPGVIRQMLFQAKTEIAELQKDLQRQMTANRPSPESQPSQGEDPESADSNQSDTPQAAGAEPTSAQEKRESGRNRNEGQNASRGDRSQKDQEKAEGQQSGEEQNARGQQANSESDQQEQRNGGDQPARFDGESNSFGSKLSNAMQNLLSALNPRPSTGRQQRAGANRGTSQRSNQQSGNQDPGSKDDGQQQDQDAAQGTQKADGGKPQDSPGTGSGESAAAKGEKRQANGAGRQDGDKAIKEAEQLEAMGKLSVLLGKRSENVTGDLAVEVESGGQSLKTQYVQKNATHADVEARTNRDEVPLALEPYVERYFEQMRKHGVQVAPRGQRRESPARH